MSLHLYRNSALQGPGSKRTAPFLTLQHMLSEPWLWPTHGVDESQLCLQGARVCTIRGQTACELP